MNSLYDAIVSGDAGAARSLTQDGMRAGADPLTLVNEFMMPAMTEVGRRFEINEYYVPQLLRSARAMKMAMALLAPLLAQGGAKSLGRVVIGTVAGDVHDIGKHLVSAMLEGGGFKVIDLGTGVSAEQFIAAASEHNADIIGMSALLTTTMYAMKTTIDEMTRAGVRTQFKTLVGGAPITCQFAEEIGADGFSNSASGAVVAAKLLLGMPAAIKPGVHIFTEPSGKNSSSPPQPSTQ